MKPLHLLCLASLLLNTALVVVVARRPVAPFAKAEKALAPAQTNSVSTSNVLPELAAHWTALHDNDLGKYTANLRAAGLPDQLVRRIIAAEIDEQFRGREEALRPPNKKLKYWQVDSSTLSLETQLALLDLRREKARLRSQILGPELASTSSDDGISIAPSKREMLKLISEDYDTMINAVRGQGGNMLLAAEKEKIKYLEAEKKREIGELLSPDEVAEYEKLNSRITQQLRWQLKNFEATEAEFNTIYTAEKTYQERLEQADTQRDESWEITQKAFNEGSAQLKTQLGDSRFADYSRARDFEYQQLAQLAQRSGLSPNVAASVFDLRESASKKSVEIFDSETLSEVEKRSALEALAASTREQIKSSLGNEVADAYFNTANRWLNTIADGKITFSDFGRSTNSTSLSSRQKSIPAK